MSNAIRGLDFFVDGCCFGGDEFCVSGDIRDGSLSSKTMFVPTPALDQDATMLQWVDDIAAVLRG